MMKKLLPFILLLFVFACEDGINIVVPASSSVSFTLPKAEVNAANDNISSVTTSVDLTQFITEDAEQIESIKLDKFTYELSGYNNTSGGLVLMDLTIQTRLNGNTNDILTIFGLVVENTGKIIAFEDGNPESALSAAQVASLESIMDNLEPFELIVSGDFTDDIDSDFNLEIAWDISISVSQDTGG